ncbi:MAG: polysaccharide deacetylase family protein [Anaerolineales bacterium]
MRQFGLFLLAVVLLVGCNNQPTADPMLIYTQAAQTVQAQMTQIAALTPPTSTVTVTMTPAPTATVTQTPTNTTVPTEPWTFVKDRVIAPILLYSHVSDNLDDNPYYQWEGDMDVTSLQFEQEIAALKAMGYQTITVSQLARAIREGAELPPHPVIITFDGGTVGIYRKAFPILKKYGFVGTVFMTVTNVNGNGTLSASQLKEMAQAGWEIGSKGWWGNNLTADYSVLSDEISGSRLKLQELLGVPVVTFSYPYGAADDMVITRVAEWGYTSAVGLFRSSEHTLGSIYYLARYEIRKNLPLTDFIAMLPWQGGGTPLPEEVLSLGTPTPESLPDSVSAPTTQP